MTSVWTSTMTSVKDLEDPSEGDENTDDVMQISDVCLGDDNDDGWGDDKTDKTGKTGWSTTSRAPAPEQNNNSPSRRAR